MDRHEWQYKDASSQAIKPLTFVARDAREGDEPFTPVVDWNPDDFAYSDDDDVTGHVIDACAAEILRLAELVKVLKEENDRFREAHRVAVLRAEERSRDAKIALDACR